MKVGCKVRLGGLQRDRDRVYRVIGLTYQTLHFLGFYYINLNMDFIGTLQKSRLGAIIGLIKDLLHVRVAGVLYRVYKGS